MNIAWIFSIPGKKKIRIKVSQRHVAVWEVELEAAWAQHMKGRAYLSPYTALSSLCRRPKLQKTLYYCLYII